MNCPHGMPTVGSCVDCMIDGNLPPAPKPEPETVEFSFPARFASQCIICDLPINIGDVIAKTTWDRYLHLECVR